jgi:hypothetical protein
MGTIGDELLPFDEVEESKSDLQVKLIKARAQARLSCSVSSEAERYFEAIAV